MYYSIIVDVDKCVGCSGCEIACSSFNEKEFNLSKSRIRIVKTEEQGMTYSVPTFCRQCEEPVCVIVCPAGAIYSDIKTGAKLIDEEKCIGCKSCVYACPLGGVAVDFDRGISVKCTLCGGDPSCVKVCAAGAIQYVRNDKIDIMQKRKNVQGFCEFQKMTTSLPLEEEV